MKLIDSPHTLNVDSRSHSFNDSLTYSVTVDGNTSESFGSTWNTESGNHERTSHGRAGEKLQARCEFRSILLIVPALWRHSSAEKHPPPRRRAGRRRPPPVGRTPSSFVRPTRYRSVRVNLWCSRSETHQTRNVANVWAGHFSENTAWRSDVHLQTCSSQQDCWKGSDYSLLQEHSNGLVRWNLTTVSYCPN